MKKFVVLFLIFIQVVSLKATDCEIYPFEKNYQENIDNQEIYFIRGIKLEANYHGIKLKVIKNFKSNTIPDTIMIWCSDGNSPRLEYSDNFDNGDTLICLITLTDLEGNDPGDNNEIPDDLEKSTDYMPIHCNYSILNNKSDSVVGKISSISKDTTISYNNFFTFLTSSLSISPNLEQGIVSVYPNPTKDYLIFNVKSTFFENFNIKVLNIDGQLIDSFYLSAGQKYFQYDTDRLINGIYMINFYINGTLVSNQKILKQ